MDRLPVEVLAKICDFFPLTERAKLREVSRCFKEAVEYKDRIQMLLAQNYLSRTSKNAYMYWSSPWFGKSFFSFINSYCSQSIEINAEGYEFETEDILPIASKLKFITCDNIYSPDYEDYDINMFNLFPQLEGFKMDFAQDYTYTEISPWCTSLGPTSKKKERKSSVSAFRATIHSIVTRSEPNFRLGCND